MTATPERKKSPQREALWLAVAIPVTAVLIGLLIRSTVLALGAGVFAAGVLIFTAQSYRRARQSLAVTQRGRVTACRTRAIRQLGSKRLQARIGGVYALERVALSSPRDHPTVMGVLAAFIREHSREKWPALELAADDDRNARTTRPDVQAAVTVIGRRNYGNDCRPVNLNGADLTAADLTTADLTDTQLCAADLTNANLTNANLTNAQLVRANLTEASLVRANLRSANLCAADLANANLANANLANAQLTDAQLCAADLTNANLVGADLADAQLVRANLTNANLRSANLCAADLTNADLTNANLTGADLTNADLTNARWPRESPMPKGWALKSRARRLGRASADIGNPG